MIAILWANHVVIIEETERFGYGSLLQLFDSSAARLANSWRRPPWLQRSVSSIVTTGFAQRVRWFSDSDCLWCTYLSLLPLAVTLIAVVFLFPVGFSAARVVMICQSDIYSLGRCTVGWTYMLYIVGTALSVVAAALSWTPIRSRKRSDNEDPIPYDSWKSDEKLSPDATAAATFWVFV